MAAIESEYVGIDAGWRLQALLARAPRSALEDLVRQSSLFFQLMPMLRLRDVEGLLGLAKLVESLLAGMQDPGRLQPSIRAFARAPRRLCGKRLQH